MAAMTRELNPNDMNVVMLERVARHLGAELCDQFAFVGGAVAGLLITDPANPPIRPTEDVDLVTAVQVLSDYHRLEKALRKCGFVQDMQPEESPICRWRVEGIAVDVVPADERILGFSNRWYPLCMTTAQPIKLPSGLTIRLIPAPVFLGTKLEAFYGRGNGDYLFSHDMGDIVSVIDGREGLLDECKQTSPDLQIYLAEKFSTFLADPRFLDALPGHLPTDAVSQGRLGGLKDKIWQIANLSNLVFQKQV